jgi:hypothetical protein
MNCSFQNANKPDKKDKKVREKWKAEDLQNALQSINSGLPVAAASRQYNIALRDWFLRMDKTPERKRERYTNLSSTVGEELKGRIVCLQQVGFGLTRKQFRLFAFKICEGKHIPHPSKKETAGKDNGLLRRFLTLLY